MRTTTDTLNRQAIACEEAQSLIRIAVKDGAFKRRPKDEIDKKVRLIILACLARLDSASMKSAAYRSLVAFYNSEMRIVQEIRRRDAIILFLALSRLVTHQIPVRERRGDYGEDMTLREAREIIEETPYIPEGDKLEILNYGNALNTYHDDYIKKYIRPTLNRMAEEEALDPDSEKYLGQRSTLRNRAEREVRWQGHIDEIQGFRDKGVKLVIASAHANCSPRCREWQGRVYSLDGTYGKTDDGREYVPLEVATNIPTPNGKWFNGLLGFNCRHYLVEYKPHYEFPMVSEATEKREYAIDQKQRYYERQVREWRAKAEMCRGTGAEYTTAKRKAEMYNRRYIEFSRAHKRAYYPSRTRLI